jgi:hypothetical protein
MTTTTDHDTTTTNDPADHTAPRMHCWSTAPCRTWGGGVPAWPGHRWRCRWPLGRRWSPGEPGLWSELIAGIADHITPWPSCYRSTQLGGDTKFVLSTAGHMAGLVNPPGNDRASFQVTRRPPQRRGRLAGRGIHGQGQLAAGLRHLAGQPLRPRSPRPRSLGGRGYSHWSMRPAPMSSTTSVQRIAPARRTT